MKTDWQKCDNKECGLVTFITLKSKRYDFQINVCTRHYEELRNTLDWEAS